MNQQQTPKPLTGPYRATRLWNEAIRIFNNGVPCKRHWKQLRQYENCFTAAEATSWLHTQLKANSNFGPSVSKDQVQQLLCKFLKVGVFEDVRGVETTAKNFKDNSGLYRLTNRSPFRNPRTPGRTPLGNISNRGNSTNNQAQNSDSGSPKLPQIHTKAYNHCGRDLVQCQLTARQLNEKEVEDIWKTSTLQQVVKTFGLLNVKGHLDPNKIKGKWILWNVTRIGMRGVVQSMEELDSPPPWVLYGMKSLVNWPASENHKLPDYCGSERDVFKVICDYFTNASGPLTTYSLYNLLVDAFIRAEAVDLQFQSSCGTKDETEEEEERPMSLRSNSVQSLVTKIVSPACRKTSAPLVKQEIHHLPIKMSCDYPLVPVIMKSPIQGHRTHSCSHDPASQQKKAIVKRNRSERLGSIEDPKFKERDEDTSCCYETTFTTAEPQTRMITRQIRLLGLSRRSQSDLILEEQAEAYSGKLYSRQRYSESYRSLDRLRSKSGGYVNVAAFGSADCLEQMNREEEYNGSTSNISEWQQTEFLTSSTTSIRSISSLSSHHQTTITGLSPPSALVASDSTNINENWRRHFCANLTGGSPIGGVIDGQQHLRSYRNSPSKRLVGRRKGLEFYYGAKACRPGFATIEGKTMAVESLQLLTLLLPPDLRRKLHLLLRFMAKVSSNTQLILDPEIPLKTLMINTFYRCIVCSSDESDYDELLAVRLVTFLMENTEAVMVVPHRLCVQVRDTLLDLQREKIRFQPDDVFPLAFCRQVSTEQFQQQKEMESGQAVRQLLEHIVADQNMSIKDRRKRLKQFRMAYPDIYYNKFPEEKPKENRGAVETSSQPGMIKRIRNLRLI